MRVFDPSLLSFDPTDRAFTLVELLTVVVVISVILLLAVPAVTALSKSKDVTTAAETVSGVLAQARTYAITNSTYTWVGFFEEDGSKPSTQPALSGTGVVGRVVLDIVASTNGTLPYNSANPPTAPSGFSASLTQVDRLRKIDNAHLLTFSDAGGNIDSPSPAVTVNVIKQSTPSPTIGDTTPTGGTTLFAYPLQAATPQYQFVKAIQFSPRGEARINTSLTYPLQPVMEIGLQPTHGGVQDSHSANLVSIQITGIGGDVVVYRK